MSNKETATAVATETAALTIESDRYSKWYTYYPDRDKAMQGLAATLFDRHIIQGDEYCDGFADLLQEGKFTEALVLWQEKYAEDLDHHIKIVDCAMGNPLTVAVEPKETECVA